MALSASTRPDPLFLSSTIDGDDVDDDHDDGDGDGDDGDDDDDDGTWFRLYKVYCHIRTHEHAGALKLASSIHMLIYRWTHILCLRMVDQTISS